MKWLLASCCALALALPVQLASSKEEAKSYGKCPVSGSDAKEGHAVDYKDGKVYFCCENCPKSFDKDKAKYSTKANLQLVVTGQAKQEKCPLSGGKLDSSKTAKVEGVEVQFCCGNCQKKITDAKADEQLKMIFEDKAFEKGFKVAKKEEKKFSAKCILSGDDAKEDKYVDYKDAKVYFCCDDCKKEFEKDKAKHALKANAQLVSTSQYKQAKCPLSGGKLDSSKTAKVEGVEVQFCCGNCQKKVNDAKGDEQLKLVFDDKAFEKGFELVKAEKK